MRRPTISPRTDTLFPDTTLFRSLDRRLDLRVVDPGIGAEHDRAGPAGTLAAELLFEGVETPRALPTGGGQVLAEAATDRAGDGSDHDDADDPGDGDGFAAPEAPGTTENGRAPV